MKARMSKSCCMNFCKGFLLIFCLSFAGCSNSYDKMIENFNEKYFKKGYLPPEPYTTKSKGFDENFILDDVVSMVDGSFTVLTAPDGGEECIYEWKAFIPSKDSTGKDYMKEEVIGDERVLNYLAPGVFNSDKENKLVITVTEKSGKQFTDTARVFITIE